MVHAKKAPIALGQYQHFKGQNYEVIGVAVHSQTLEELVVYRALYDSDEFGPNALWVRPRDIFFSDVMVEGKLLPRFRKLEN